MAAAAQAYGNSEIGWTGPVILNCSVVGNSVQIFFNESLLRDDAVTVFPPIGSLPGGLVHDIHPETKLDLCKNLPGNASNPYCSSFGGVTPMEIEYTINNGTDDVSVWLPVSLHTKQGPFINTDCKPNPKHPDFPVCTNYTRKDGWSMVQTHAQVGSKRSNVKYNFTDVITGIRYAWGPSPCCPTIDRNNLPCPPNSCPIRSYNSTLPAAPFIAKIVRGVCKCTPPQVCG